MSLFTYDFNNIFLNLLYRFEPQNDITANLSQKCEKHARKEEALLKLSEGVKFDEVARTYSEDKARQGTFSSSIILMLRYYT